jgi:hypothetical protein
MYQGSAKGEDSMEEKGEKEYDREKTKRGLWL